MSICDKLRRADTIVFRPPPLSTFLDLPLTGLYS